MHKQIRGYFDMAQDYHIAAASLWMQIMDAPYLYNPIRYLLRHTIELLLKGLIVMELRKDDKQLVLKNVRIGSRPMNNSHSLNGLWEHYKQLASSHNIILDSSDKCFIDKVITKADKNDVNSAKYRYSVDKDDKVLNLQPIGIQSGRIAPDLALGVPSIVQCDKKVEILNKGQELMQEGMDLFEVVELLFQLFDNPKSKLIASRIYNHK